MTVELGLGWVEAGIHGRADSPRRGAGLSRYVVLVDEDGVVVVPRGRTAEVLAQARNVAECEATIEAECGWCCATAGHARRPTGRDADPMTTVDVVDRLRALPTAAISDALDRASVESTLQGIAPPSDALRAAGPAFTVRLRLDRPWGRGHGRGLARQRAAWRGRGHRQRRPHRRHRVGRHHDRGRRRARHRRNRDQRRLPGRFGLAEPELTAVQPRPVRTGKDQVRLIAVGQRYDTGV